MLPPPEAAPSAAPADWIRQRYQWGGPWVIREVGPGFERYVRVFHPYGDGNDARTWLEVAAEHGKTMHPAANWDEITTDGPWDPGIDPDANANGAAYLQGNLPRPVLAAVCGVLRRHTATPEDCYFAVWGGWGWDHMATVTSVRDGEPPAAPRAPSSVRLDPGAPRFGVIGRDFLLYHGVVEQALDIGGGDYYEGQGFLFEQSPTLMWPADHAWCLSTELDAEYTIIGGTHALADDLLTTAGVEALIVAPDEPPVSPINQ